MCAPLCSTSDQTLTGTIHVFFGLVSVAMETNDFQFYLIVFIVKYYWKAGVVWKGYFDKPRVSIMLVK